MHLEQNKTNIKAIILATFGYFLYSLGDSGNKLMVGEYHAFVILFWGSLFSLMVVGGYGAVKYGGLGFLKTYSGNVKFHILRGFASLATGCLVVTALKTIQMDEFYAVIFTSPLWVAVLGRIILKDRINFTRLLALVSGFTIVLFMMRPDGDMMNFGTLLTAIAALTAASSMILVRCMTPRANDKLLFALTGPFMAVTCLGLYLITTDLFVIPKGGDLVVIFLCSIFFSVGAVATCIAYQSATSASAVAPFHYTQMIWGILLGYALFSDVPTYEVLMGGTLLIVTGVFMIRAEAHNFDPREKELEYLFDLAE